MAGDMGAVPVPELTLVLPLGGESGCLHYCFMARRSEVVRMAVYGARPRHCNDSAVAVVESPYQALRGEERIALGFSRQVVVKHLLSERQK